MTIVIIFITYVNRGEMMADSDRNKKQEVLQYIRDNPYISQRDLALRLHISRSAVAAHIAALIKEGEIIGRAYVVPDRQRILCIGGANVDRKIQTNEPLQLGTSNPAFLAESHGGVARNIAENLARLGVPPTLVTMVGEDKEGEMLLATIAGLGTDVSQVIRSSTHRTGTYTAILDVDGSMTVACADMAIYDDFSMERLAPRTKLLSQSAIAIVDTNLPVESLDFVIRQSEQMGTNLIVAPVSSPKAKRLPPNLQGIHTLIANLDEIAAISGMTTDTDVNVQRACMALKGRGCSTIVVTMGKEGVIWLDANGTFERMAADPIEVIDVTGAGDAFVAGFAYATYHAASVRQACHFASHLSRLALATKETVSTVIEPRIARTWLQAILSTN